MSKELNTVLRRQASTPQAQQARRQAGRTAEELFQLHRRIPRQTKERMIAPFAGFCSAAIEISATYPMEQAKVLSQLNRSNPNFNVIQHMRGNGFKSMYNGVSVLLIGAPIQGLIRFSALDYFNNKLADPATGRISVASGLLGGLAAGVLESVVVVAPMETVKTRLIESKKGLLDGVKYIVRNHGVSGLYKGLGPTIAKSASNQGLRFIIFNQYKNMMLENPTTDKLTPLQALGGGMLAGALGCVGNTPFDTVKSRMQGLEAARYRSMVHCLGSMVKEEGFLSLYKGFWPRLARVLPGQGIIFMSYSTISDSLKSKLD